MAEVGEEGGRPVQPELLEGLRYDGPPELAAAWDAFTRRFAAVEKPGKKDPAFSRSRVEQANLLNDLAFGQGGATSFLEGHGIRTMPQRQELPALQQEEAQGHARAIEVLGLQDASDREKLTQLRKDIEDVAVALGEATAKEAEDHAPARELFNAVNRRLIAQWADRERAFGLYPQESHKGDIPQPVRIRRQALLDDAAGELLSGALYSLQAPILVKAGYELLWHRLGDGDRKRHSEHEVLGDAAAQFRNALFSFDPAYGREFTHHVRGAVELLAGRGYQPVPRWVRRERTRTLSLDRRLPDGDGRVTTGAQLVADTREEPPEEQAARQEWNARVRQVVQEMAACGELSPRQHSVLVLRFGLDTREPLTLEQTGARLGITKEAARQAEARGLATLQGHPAFAALLAEMEGISEEAQAPVAETRTTAVKAAGAQGKRRIGQGR